MKENVSESEFIQRFVLMNRENNFSYEGRRALFEYLESYEEDTGEEIDLDIIALCCEYSEFDDIEDYIKQYGTDIEKKDFEFYEDKESIKEEYEKAVLEEIQDKTTLINIEGSEGFIIQQY